MPVRIGGAVLAGGYGETTADVAFELALSAPSGLDAVTSART